MPVSNLLLFPVLDNYNINITISQEDHCSVFYCIAIDSALSTLPIASIILSNDTVVYYLFFHFFI